MNKIIFVFMAVIALAGCQETWKGVKKDTKTIATSVGEAGNHLGKKIGDAVSGDNDEGVEE